VAGGTQRTRAMSGPVRYCGREFSPHDLAVIVTLAATLPTRRAIADAVCDALSWRRPDGRPKDMSARVALIRMANDGLITLPPPQKGNGNGRIARYADPTAEPPATPITGPLHQLGPLHLTVVDTKAASQQWRGLIAAHHYLGYTPFAGAQLRYLVHGRLGPIAALGFAASAWTCAPRDNHIGWDPAQRQARLHLVVGNARFLILPHVTVPNLASHLLAQVTTRLRTDWHNAYGYQPVLLETFVETGRFTGTTYKAANWLHIGRTTGRGKLDRYNQYAVPVKDIYLYPLHRAYLAYSEQNSIVSRSCR
jgi:Druantia protein DruA